MEAKKYELTDETIEYVDKTVYRIRALRDFGDVKAGDLGGYIEKEDNLSHEGNCWVYDDAMVCNDAAVYDNAKIRESAMVIENAKIYENADIYGNAEICDNVHIYNKPQIFGNARLFDNVIINSETFIYDSAFVSGNTTIYGPSRIYGDAVVSGDINIYNDVKIYGGAHVHGVVTIFNNVIICGDAVIYNSDVFNDSKIQKGSDYLCIQGIGSEYRMTVVYRDQSDDVIIKCGCFKGSLDEFKKSVEYTHGDNKYAQEYLTLIQLIKIHFEI